MNIDEHNEKAFEEVLQLAKDNDIAAEDAELKYLDSEYPRFKDASDKKGGTSGYLKILSDEDGIIHWIMAKSYHDELSEVIWRSDGLHSLSTEQQEEKLDELKKLQSQRDEQLQLQLAENRLALGELLKTLTSASEQHPYLIKKQVSSHGILMRGNELVIPLHEYKGDLITAQRIFPDGTKYFFKDCGKKGACYVISGDDSTILIAEGYATAASCFEATGYTCIMAIDCGNLIDVAKVVRSKTNAPIVIVADNDKYKEKNAGVEAAEKAAKLVGGAIFIPEFQDETTEPTDANDLVRITVKEIGE